MGWEAGLPSPEQTQPSPALTQGRNLMSRVLAQAAGSACVREEPGGNPSLECGRLQTSPPLALDRKQPGMEDAHSFRARETSA